MVSETAPCEVCLTRTLCKNTTKRGMDSKLIYLCQKCPDLSNWLFPKENELNMPRYRIVAKLMGT